jgi:clan AA aspartic protease (TIGR02281 family)
VVALILLSAALAGLFFFGQTGREPQEKPPERPAAPPAETPRREGVAVPAPVAAQDEPAREKPLSSVNPSITVAEEPSRREPVEVFEWTEIPQAQQARWAEVIALESDGRRRLACVGAVLRHGALLCPVEVLVKTDRLQIQWGDRRFEATSAAGWDLDRGYCLIRLPGAVEGFGVATARPGDTVTAVSVQRKKTDVMLEDPADYGLEGLPLSVARAGEGTCFLLRDDHILAVAWYRWPGMPVVLFGTVGDVTVQEEVNFAAWNERVWAGSAYSYYCQGRDAFRKADFAAAAELLSEAYARNPGLWGVLEGDITDAYLKWAGEFSAAGELEEARATLLKALEVVPQSKEVLLVLSREEASLELLEDALIHAREALAQDDALFAKRWRILEDRYLRLAASLEAGQAIELLYEGVNELPDSVNLRVELGTLLFKDRQFADAIAFWEEAYNLSRDREIAKLIEDARRIAAAEDQVVVIPIPDGSSTIRTPVTFAGRLDVSCIVDTGASFTAMPTWVAEELGISARDGKHVRIATASGVRDVPLVTIPSVSLGKLEVGPIEVLILDLPHPMQRQSPGLLGLNFLRNFNVAIDRQRNELRISPR